MDRRADLPALRDLLRRGADPNAANRFGMSALIYAARGGDTPFVRLLVEAGADLHYFKRDLGCVDETTPLFEAVNFLRLGTVRYLLRAGADVNQCYEQGFTLLMQAVTAGPGNFQIPVIRTLLDYGADVNARHSNGTTALRCVRPYQLRVAQVLVEAGAEVDRDLISEILNWPNHMAYRWNHYPMLRWLIAQGADVDACNRRGQSALLAARQRGSTRAVRILLEAGARP